MHNELLCIINAEFTKALVIRKEYAGKVCYLGRNKLRLSVLYVERHEIEITHLTDSVWLQLQYKEIEIKIGLLLERKGKQIACRPTYNSRL